MTHQEYVEYLADVYGEKVVRSVTRADGFDYFILKSGHEIKTCTDFVDEPGRCHYIYYDMTMPTILAEAVQ